MVLLEGTETLLIEDVWQQRECIKSIKFEDASQAVVKMHKLWGCIRDVSQDQREIEEHLVVVDEGRPTEC